MDRYKQRIRLLKLTIMILTPLIMTFLFPILLQDILHHNNKVFLPPPDLEGYLPLSVAMNENRVSDTLIQTKLTVSDISQLLWSLQGITHGASYRTAPSAGATYPLEIYFCQLTDTPLKKGYYAYSPFEHCLSIINTNFTEESLQKSLPTQSRLNTSTVIFILADYNRTTEKYGNRGRQYVHLETGHALQNLLLQLVSLDLYTNIITAFNVTQVKYILNTTLNPLLILPIGKTAVISSTKDHTNTTTLTSTGGLTVEQAIAKRKSIRDYTHGEIPSTVLQDIINTSTAINYFEENYKHINLISVVGEVSGLSAGLYRHFMENQSLIRYNTGDYRQPLQDAALKQPWIGNAQLDLVVLINSSWVFQHINPDLTRKVLMYNIGMIAQNIYHKCTSYGLGNVVVGAFEDTKVALLLGFPSSFIPIYIIPIGLTPSFN